MGRCLPYGEGVTYWPLAEMVKAAAGISDDDPLEEAFEKLRECCAEEAVADVLGLAAGLMEALEGERSPQEIAWAAREVMQGIAEVQPLILMFEDIHWAEAPLLDLIEHIADWVRAPVLILCLARPELLDARPGWGGGRVRSTAIELEPLSEEESAELVEQLLSQLAGASGERPTSLPQDALDRAEGNPLFVEETIRMLVESGSGNGSSDRVPDTLQALIAARIDHLAPAAKTLLQRGSVVGRVFWRGALEHLRLTSTTRGAARRPAPARVPASRAALVDLRRDRLPVQARAHPRGRVHGAGQARACAVPRSLRRVARRAHGGGARRDPRVPPRPGRRVPDRARGRCRPRSSRRRLRQRSSRRPSVRSRGRRTRSRGRSVSGRSSFDPTLGARYIAARAAWRLQDWAAVQVEMAKVRDQAHEQDERGLEALALTALGEAVAQARRRPGRAQELVDRGARAPRRGGRSRGALRRAHRPRDRRRLARPEMDDVVRYMERAYVMAIDAGRKDLQTIAAQVLASDAHHSARARRSRAPADPCARARGRERQHSRARAVRLSPTAGSST